MKNSKLNCIIGDVVEFDEDEKVITKIFDRKIDYFLAPVPIFTALIAAYITTVSDTPWQIVFAISSIGGVVATASYGLYLAVQCQQLIKKI